MEISGCSRRKGKLCISEDAYWPRVARIWRLPEPRGRPLRRPELKLARSLCPAVCMPLPTAAAASPGSPPPRLHASGVAVASPPWPASAGGGDGVGDVDGEGEDRYPFAASCAASAMVMSALKRPWPETWPPPATATPSLPSITNNVKGSSLVGTWSLLGKFLVLGLLLLCSIGLKWRGRQTREGGHLLSSFALCPVTTRHQQAAAGCASIIPKSSGKILFNFE
jgi:hypothetical protein